MPSLSRRQKPCSRLSSGFARRADVARGDDLVVADDDGADRAAEAGAPAGDFPGDAEIIFVLGDAFGCHRSSSSSAVEVLERAVVDDGHVGQGQAARRSCWAAGVAAILLALPCRRIPRASAADSSRPRFRTRSNRSSDGRVDGEQDETLAVAAGKRPRRRCGCCR